ncbi:O-methyltransferase [Sphingomonas sp. SUN019]|uniref:O-methyltransferase n=1 Tax=Sphingomonas sp. SUN019 TaxID=2937788 RepID=UPI0021648116|nr:O-methyltransferase [Sphingomonas sp. SUN019]UVO52127.1 O-methyltransferase [Sphingomonas sp. SUN019]
MVERLNEPDAGWVAVDRYIADKLIGDDPVAALAANAAVGLPDIDVSAAQGKMLHLFAMMAGARRVLEVGTLGGYSTIWLARAVGDGGEVVTLEVDPHHASVARGNVDAAGVGERVDIRVGPAVETLATLDGAFDLIFVDADKPSNVVYLREALTLSRPGTVIVFDNVVREGGVLEADSDDDRIRGTRALFDAVAAEPRLSATAVQTVGAKKWDGFLLAVVGASPDRTES